MTRLARMVGLTLCLATLAGCGDDDDDKRPAQTATPVATATPTAGNSPPVIAETTRNLRQMSVEEAVMELDLTQADIVMFRHAGHGGLNVVYRRADGNIGWIDPALRAN